MRTILEVIDLVFLFGFFSLNLRILQFHAGFTCENRTARWEGSGFVGLVRVQFALVIGQWQRAAVLNQFQESVEMQNWKVNFHLEFQLFAFILLWRSVLGHNAGRAATEWTQLPGFSGLNGGTTGGCKAHARKIWKKNNETPALMTVHTTSEFNSIAVIFKNHQTSIQFPTYPPKEVWKKSCTASDLCKNTIFLTWLIWLNCGWMYIYMQQKSIENNSSCIEWSTTKWLSYANLIVCLDSV